MLRTWYMILNINSTFRTAVPFWEQITLILSTSSPKRDCDPQSRSGGVFCLGKRAFYTGTNFSVLLCYGSRLVSQSVLEVCSDGYGTTSIQYSHSVQVLHSACYCWLLLLYLLLLLFVDYLVNRVQPMRGT